MNHSTSNNGTVMIVAIMLLIVAVLSIGLLIGLSEQNQKAPAVLTPQKETQPVYFVAPLPQGCHQNETGHDPSDLVMHIECGDTP